MYRFRLTVIGLLVVLASAVFPYDISKSAAVEPIILTINGVVPHPKSFTASELKKLPRTSVQVKGADGSSSNYEGPLMSDVLAEAGVVFGQGLKGAGLSDFVVATGADKFRVVFALPELDASFTNDIVIIADTRDGQPLSAAEGPLRSVVRDEKRTSRWVKQLTTLTLLHSPAAAPGSPARSGKKKN